ncbi:MAG: hypothetical protein JO106_07400 [Mycobacterium sp.]|nr:hypothetical protein [Mycobacterium sp.]
MPPNVYLPTQVQPSLEQRIVAAWRWSHREGTIAGAAAAAVHGTKWIDDDISIELIYPNARPPRGYRHGATCCSTAKWLLWPGSGSPHQSAPHSTSVGVSRAAPRLPGWTRSHELPASKSTTRWSWPSVIAALGDRAVWRPR